MVEVSERYRDAVEASYRANKRVAAALGRAHRAQTDAAWAAVREAEAEAKRLKEAWLAAYEAEFGPISAL